eukprot:8365026-Prorocentrum_lima.AAC.1
MHCGAVYWQLRTEREGKGTPWRMRIGHRGRRCIELSWRSDVSKKRESIHPGGEAAHAHQAWRGGRYRGEADASIQGRFMGPFMGLFMMRRDARRYK